VLLARRLGPARNAALCTTGGHCSTRKLVQPAWNHHAARANPRWLWPSRPCAALRDSRERLLAPSCTRWTSAWSCRSPPRHHGQMYRDKDRPIWGRVNRSRKTIRLASLSKSAHARRWYRQSPRLMTKRACRSSGAYEPTAVSRTCLRHLLADFVRVALGRLSQAGSRGTAAGYERPNESLLSADHGRMLRRSIDPQPVHEPLHWSASQLLIRCE